jgi:hypothetical protein
LDGFLVPLIFILKIMELRTTFGITPSPHKITYSDPVMFIGSCFSSYMGLKMSDGHMPVMINPSGTVYNPVSALNTLETILARRSYTREDLILDRGTWHSFNHYSEFSGDDPEKVLERINRNNEKAYTFLKKTRFLFITFGTARVYRYRKTGLIVSNCHKLPAKEFESELLTVKDIVILWSRMLDELHIKFPSLKVIFTISPVRHWKDGAHGNQVSKSVLFIALEDLLKNVMSAYYFPAYELVMDDLRDYRFYDEDMLHLSSVAVSYIWDAFAACYLDRETYDTWSEVTKISRATGHRFISDSSSARKEFAQRMLMQIERIMKVRPGIDLSGERKYFMDITK